MPKQTEPILSKEEQYTILVRKTAYPIFSRQMLARDEKGAFKKHDPKVSALNEIKALSADTSDTSKLFYDDCHYMISIYSNGVYDEKKWSERMANSPFFNLHFDSDANVKY